MRKTFLRIQGGALLGVLIAIGFAMSACADGRDFSGGITDMSTAPVRTGSAADPEWQAQQKTVEAQAAAALAASQGKKAIVAPGQLGPGDKVRLTVFGEEDLSGEFEIDSTGSLAMPLVGEIPVRGLTPRELEKKLAVVLEEGYLKNPRVNIEVLNFRPFFILGEVNKPGSYPYANDMTVINAVALAGGYTTRAKTGQVKLRRASAPEKEDWARENEMIYPGDVLRVDERFF